MLGIISMAGNALKAFGNTHPAVKWGVIVLAFLLAAEFVAKEGVSVYRDMATVGVEVRVQNARAANPNDAPRLTPEQLEKLGVRKETDAEEKERLAGIAKAAASHPPLSSYHSQ